MPETYFTAIGIPVLRGRALGEIDRAGRPLVAVINEAMGREVFGDEDPLGHRFTFGENGLTAGSFTIVGVVGNARQQSLEQASEPQLYPSFDQAPRSRMDIVVKSAAPSPSMLAMMREQLWSIRSDLPIRRPVLMTDYLSGSIADSRFYVLLLGGFAFVALSLALVGIYGTLSYAVSQRTHEMGVRMALGAGATVVLSLVIRRGMTLVAIGAVGGVGTGVLVNRVLESFMFGITSTDPATIAGGVAAVVLASFLACVVPAWRAARLDPMVALRGE